MLNAKEQTITAFLLISTFVIVFFSVTAILDIFNRVNGYYAEGIEASRGVYE